MNLKKLHENLSMLETQKTKIIEIGKYIDTLFQNEVHFDEYLINEMLKCELA
jgi:hypothetical protein